MSNLQKTNVRFDDNLSTVHNNNVRFQENGEKMFGNPFGYAIQYAVIEEDGNHYIQFSPAPLVMAENPQNTIKPYPVDLASQCIYTMAKESGVWVKMYGCKVHFNAHATFWEIKEKIQKFQRSVIHISSDLPADVRQHINTHLKEVIKGMPIY